MSSTVVRVGADERYHDDEAIDFHKELSDVDSKTDLVGQSFILQR